MTLDFQIKYNKAYSGLILSPTSDMKDPMRIKAFVIDADSYRNRP